MSFNGKVVLVTGASSGIGAAIANLFAKEGATVSIVGRNQAKLDKVAEEIKKVGAAPLVINADIAIDKEAKRIVDDTVKHFGKLDILINNAGLLKEGCLVNGDVIESYDVTMSVNVRAAINITAHAVPHLKATKGNVINISSVAAMLVPQHPNFTCYYMSKAALDKFTQSAALELAPFGIRVNSINPGPVVTDFMENAKMLSDMSGFSADMRTLSSTVPLKRVSEPEEIADLTLFLASEKARSVTGSLYTADNGAFLSNTF